MSCTSGSMYNRVALRTLSGYICNSMRKALSFILLIVGLAALLLLGSMGRLSGDAMHAPLPENNRHITIVNHHLVDSAVSLLCQGDVVLRMGTGAYSHLMAQMNRSDKRFSHCGIVMIEDGHPFVYHSIGGEDNPDARLRRDSAAAFFDPGHNTAIAVVKYRLAPAQQQALTAVVGSFYDRQPRFDTKFDLRTDDWLYCTEFVYKAMAAATGDPQFIPVTEVMGHRFVGTDNLYHQSPGHLIWQVRFK